MSVACRDLVGRELDDFDVFVNSAEFLKMRQRGELTWSSSYCYAPGGLRVCVHDSLPDGRWTRASALVQTLRGTEPRATSTGLSSGRTRGGCDVDRRSSMGRACFLTYSEEVLALRLVPVFSRIFETYVDPYSLLISSATGYWSHAHQDVQRFTEHHKPGRPHFDFGSWDLTVSYAAALTGIAVVDNRSLRVRDSDLEVVTVRSARSGELPWYEVPKLVAN